MDECKAVVSPVDMSTRLGSKRRSDQGERFRFAKLWVP
ncbi:hypothetical protein Pcac1_g21198 [Phytophthora cactorum]|nr:hypothetical protein Pcac1_g21198 [Phytophthora cactorum]